MPVHATAYAPDIPNTMAGSCGLHVLLTDVLGPYSYTIPDVETGCELHLSGWTSGPLACPSLSRLRLLVDRAQQVGVDLTSPAM